MDAITTRTARIELVEDRIVVARIGDGVQTVEDARANLDACARLAAPDRKPLLVDIRAGEAADAGGAPRLHGRAPRTSFAAMGMLVRGSPLGRTMGNVYLKIARPGDPDAALRAGAKALAWLRERRK